MIPYSAINLVVVILIGLPAVATAQEPIAKASPALRLVESESKVATRMLQLRWDFGRMDSVVREDLFWFAERKPRNDEQAAIPPDFDLAGSSQTFNVTEGDGLEGWSRTVISVKEIFSNQIVIKVERATGKWSDKLDPAKSVKELDDVIKIPTTNVGPTTQGKVKFTARWWRLAQPSNEP